MPTHIQPKAVKLVAIRPELDVPLPSAREQPGVIVMPARDLGSSTISPGFGVNGLGMVSLRRASSSGSMPL